MQIAELKMYIAQNFFGWRHVMCVRLMSSIEHAPHNTIILASMHTMCVAIYGEHEGTFSCTLCFSHYARRKTHTNLHDNLCAGRALWASSERARQTVRERVWVSGPTKGNAEREPKTSARNQVNQNYLRIHMCDASPWEFCWRKVFVFIKYMHNSVVYSAQCRRAPCFFIFCDDLHETTFMNRRSQMADIELI